MAQSEWLPLAFVWVAAMDGTQTWMAVGMPAGAVLACDCESSVRTSVFIGKCCIYGIEVKSNLKSNLLSDNHHNPLADERQIGH